MNSLRMLLVEDDVEVRQTMRAWLAPLFPEWTFEETNCGEAALGIVALRPPTIVLMDYKLPGLSGLEANRRIKASAPQRPDVFQPRRSAPGSAETSSRPASRRGVAGLPGGAGEVSYANSCSFGR